MATVRYIADDVPAATRFYADHLGFSVEMEAGRGFAILTRGDLRLLLNAPGAGGAGQPADDGRAPEPGGWARFQIELADLDAAVAELAAVGCRIRTSVVEGTGGRQALVEDPSGNAVELFQPRGAPVT